MGLDFTGRYYMWPVVRIRTSDSFMCGSDCPYLRLEPNIYHTGMPRFNNMYPAVCELDRNELVDVASYVRYYTCTKHWGSDDSTEHSIIVLKHIYAMGEENYPPGSVYIRPLTCYKNTIGSIPAKGVENVDTFISFKTDICTSITGMYYTLGHRSGDLFCSEKCFWVDRSLRKKRSDRMCRLYRSENGLTPPATYGFGISSTGDNLVRTEECMREFVERY